MAAKPILDWSARIARKTLRNMTMTKLLVCAAIALVLIAGFADIGAETAYANHGLSMYAGPMLALPQAR
jgi:hypothetical protein